MNTPAPVNLKQLSGPHASELRNPLIAEAFHRTGAVEVWGRGTNRVIAECLAHGIPPPLFEELQGWVDVTFLASIVSAGAGRVPPESGKKTREKILRAIRSDPEITTAQLVRAVGLSVQGVEWNIKKMKDAAILKRVGPDKGGRWEVTR